MKLPIIKFRAKEYKSKTWVYGYYLKKNGEHLIYSESTDIFHNIDPNTLGQLVYGYTDFYEGDITKNSEGYTGLIDRRYISDKECIECSGHGEYHDVNARKMVIGNVFDNPNLIESYWKYRNYDYSILNNVIRPTEIESHIELTDYQKETVKTKLVSLGIQLK
jgi:hypothetical protein